MEALEFDTDILDEEFFCCPNCSDVYMEEASDGYYICPCCGETYGKEMLEYFAYGAVYAPEPDDADCAICGNEDYPACRNHCTFY